EERDQRDQVLETVGLQALDQIPHAAGLELKYRGRLAAVQELVGLPVVDRYRGEIERRLAARRPRGVDRRERLVDDRQRLQPQEVELHEADRLEVVLVE